MSSKIATYSESSRRLLGKLWPATSNRFARPSYALSYALPPRTALRCPTLAGTAPLALPKLAEAAVLLGQGAGRTAARVGLSLGLEMRRVAGGLIAVLIMASGGGAVPRCAGGRPSSDTADAAVAYLIKHALHPSRPTKDESEQAISACGADCGYVP